MLNNLNFFHQRILNKFQKKYYGYKLAVSSAIINDHNEVYNK